MPTDGFRQFTSLFRKNVLVKSRRPCATFFEMALPLVLFALLVYVRSVYEPVTVGPNYYKNNLLTPIGASFIGEALDSKALTDNNASRRQWEDTQRSTFPQESILMQVAEDALCSDSLAGPAADALEVVLALPAGEADLAQALLRLDPVAAADDATSFLDEARRFAQSGELARNSNQLRADFFDANLDVTVTQVAQRLQSEIDQLNPLLSDPDGASKAGQLAQGWYREACQANFSIGGEQVNRTALARLFFDLGRWLQENGVISLLQQPTQAGGDNLNDIAQDVTQGFPNATGALAEFLGNLTEGFNIPAGGIPTILEQLGGLAFQGGGAASDAAEQLAGLLNAAQALSRLGFDPATALPILAGLGLSGANLGSIDFSSPLSVLSALTDSRNLELLLVAAGLLLEQASTANLQQFSSLVDRGAYWISHFVKPGSLTASLLGERTADGMRNDDDDFQTEAGGEAFNLLQWLQTTGVPALLGAQAASLPFAAELLRNASIPGNPVNVALTDAASFLSRIANASLEEIETEIIPGLENSTFLDCSDEAIRSFGDLIALTHERCPFYRTVVRDFAGGRLEQAARDGIDGFRSFDFNALDAQLRQAASDIPTTRELLETPTQILVRLQMDFGYQQQVYARSAAGEGCLPDRKIRSEYGCLVAVTSQSLSWEGLRTQGPDMGCYYDNLGRGFYTSAANVTVNTTGEVCLDDEAANLTKVHEFVGGGFCRPAGCNDPEALSCRVTGYFKLVDSLAECRRACDTRSNCIGYTFMARGDSQILANTCYVHINTIVRQDIPDGWTRYPQFYSNIAGTSGSSMALCYRVQARNPSIPTQRGCYFKHETPSPVCRGPVSSWTLDWWGTERWQGDTEAACLARKEGHDQACQVNSSWLFVPWSTEVPPATTRAVSEHLTWLIIKEILKSSNLPRCRRVPLSESPAVSWGTWSDDGRRRRGGRGGDDDRRLQSQAASYIAEYLSQRKVLVAPYTGEVKELIDMAVVEAIIGAFEDDTSGQRQANLPGFLGLLTRCPLVKGAIASTVLESASDQFMFFDTREEMEDFARRQPDEVLMAIEFRSADGNGNFPADRMDAEFSIRVNAQLLPSTSRLIRFTRAGFVRAGSFYSYPYIDLGFTMLQEVIGSAAARLQAIREARKNPTLTVVGQHTSANLRTEPGRRLRVMLEQFPLAMQEVDNFIGVIQFLMPMFLVLGWIYAVSLMVREIVYEKQEHLRDVMRIQGLKTWVYWLSWFMSGMTQLTLLVIILTTLLSVGAVLEHSDFSVLFFFYLTYSVSTVSFAMFISSFFSRAKVAAAFAGLIYWMAYMPYALYQAYEESMSYDAKNAMCLMSPTALGVGMLYVGKWEIVKEGVHWSNLFVAPITNSGAAPTDSHSLGTVMCMLLLDAVLYQVLAWYIEKVKPGSLGLPQPWYFPVMRSYWFPPVEEGRTMALAHGGLSHEQSENQLLECWEAPSPEVASKVSVQLKGLSKTFPNGKQALKGITLDMQQDTIMGLLGHNGAGKSTTMSILTGLYPPTSGDALVHGASVRKDSLGVRRVLGVCLQHNALYENFTVEEHLRLFCLLKSVPIGQVAGEVDKLLADTGLEVKRRVPSRALSGGMKRKLSIAIALAGGSKVVTLDEPTAGVDATARRDIWHLLVKYKVGRTILLSTHFMDEADILSDRIAIIAEGRLTAIASSMTLKRYFAEGYMLTVVSDDSSNGQGIASFVLGAVTRSTFAGARGREFCFALPFSSRSQFPELFLKLQDEAVRRQLKINAYGLSAPSMEEVFLKASSVHEKGLHGQVRNLTFDPNSLPGGGDPSRPPLPFNAGEPSAGAVVDRDPKDHTPKAGESIGATPVVLGLPITDRQAQMTPRTPRDEDKPQSPQCMTSPAPQVASDPQEGGVSLSRPADEAPSAALMYPDSDAEAATTVVKQISQASGKKAAHVRPELQTGPTLWLQQFDAIFRKRALSVRRDRRAWASQVLLPALFVFVALLTARILEVEVEEPPLRLSTDQFVGTVWSGGQREVAKHKIPFADELDTPLSRSFVRAFDQGKGDGDSVEMTSAGTLMGKHLMDPDVRQDLINSYSAFSLSGEDGGQTNLTMWFKREAYHGVPIMVNLWNNARMQLLGFNNSRVQVWNHPLPKTQQLVQEEMSGGNQVITDLFVALTIILAMGFIPASFVVYLVHEKASNGKHQQLLTGISPVMYWFSNYCWDFVNYLVPLLVCVIIFAAFQAMAYSGANLPAIVVLLLFYGLCMTPLMYCAEPLFAVPSTAYVTLICLNIFTGTISTLAILTLEAFVEELPTLTPILGFGQTIFPWTLPNYCLGRALLDIAVNHYANFAYEEFGVCVHEQGAVCFKDPLSWDVSGHYIFNLVLMAPAWFFLRLLIEWGCFLRGFKARRLARILQSARGGGEAGPQVEDEAVLAERSRVQSSVRSAKAGLGDSLVIDNLEKCFARTSCMRNAVTHRAVRGISVGVPPGECFGLLGVNGAGKTTTMRMITGDTDVTNGDILVGGASVQANRDAARRRLGYCPQFDALPDKLTVRETLSLYARIRGVPREEVAQVTETMVRKMCLEAHQHNLCEYLSGGNKRKLSTALALIGEPDVVLLDEPSTGVDVGARRFLWEIIGDIRLNGHAVVLTSHSMEECEVLCTRLTIMVHGQFRCLGSPVELKARYGGGYSLAVKSLPGQEALGRSTEQNTAQIRQFVRSKIPWARLAEVSVGLLRYRLKGAQTTHGEEELPLAEIFRLFEEASNNGGSLEGCLSDYSISQTSLEEVFLHFSREAGVIEDPEIQMQDIDDASPLPPASAGILQEPARTNLLEEPEEGWSPDAPEQEATVQPPQEDPTAADEGGIIPL